MDPRIKRTRKLIMDSFINISEKKEFKDITVKDITEEAMINRATFYYHFEDKFDLLEKALSEVLQVNLNYDDFKNNELNEDTLVNIFIAITEFQRSLSQRCHRGYEDTIARIIREQVEIICYKMLLKQNNVTEDEALKLTAVILSWGIYGASVEWRNNNKGIAPEHFIQLALPYLIAGINSSK